MHHWLWGMDAPAFVPSDSHGGCPKPRGFGEAIVPEWARRNLVTLPHSALHLIYIRKRVSTSWRQKGRYIPDVPMRLLLFFK